MQLKSVLFVSLWMCIAQVSQAREKTPPVPTDYPVSVSSAPFSNVLILTNEQKGYSERWKKNAREELSKPVNFAGKYRLFTYTGISEKECPGGGVCGWVIDKTSGQIVSELPATGDSHVYNQVGDNGTPTGIDFRALFNSNSLLFSLTAQTMPKEISFDNNGEPTGSPCETNYYKFENNKFIRVFEDKNGCHVD